MAFFTAFWSYKGGVGRTTAIATVACILAKRGYRVLLWDLDLLAPTLEQLPIFRGQAERSPGFVSVLDDAVRQKGESSADLEIEFAAAVCPIKLDIERANKRSKEVEPTLWLLPARGAASEEVIKRVAVIAWEELYRQELGFHVWETLKGMAASYRPGMGERPMDVILMDASAGYTMLGKIADIHLADHVMAFTRLTPLSIEESGKHLGWLKRQYKDVHREPMESSLLASPVGTRVSAEVMHDRRKMCLVHFGQEPDVIVPFYEDLLTSDHIYVDEPPLAYRSIADRLEMVNEELPVERREQAAAAFAFSQFSSSSVFLELAGLRARSGFPPSACRAVLQESLPRMKERGLSDDAALVKALLSLPDGALREVLPAFAPEAKKPTKGRGHFDVPAMAAPLSRITSSDQSDYIRVERFLTALSRTGSGGAYKVYLDELYESRRLDPWYWAAYSAHGANNLHTTVNALRSAFTRGSEALMKQSSPYRPGMSFHINAFIGRADPIRSVYSQKGRFAFPGRKGSGKTWLLHMFAWLWSSEDEAAVFGRLRDRYAISRLSDDDVLGARIIDGAQMGKAIEAAQSVTPLVDELCAFLRSTCGIKIKPQTTMAALVEAVKKLKAGDKDRVSKFCLLFDDIDLCVTAWDSLGEDSHRGLRALFEVLGVRCLCVSYRVDGPLGGEAGYRSVLPTLWYSNVLPSEPTKDDIDEAKGREESLPDLEFQSFHELQACLWGYHYARSAHKGGGHA